MQGTANPIFDGTLTRALDDMKEGDIVAVLDFMMPEEIALDFWESRRAIRVPNNDAADVLGEILRVIPIADEESAIRCCVDFSERTEGDDSRPEVMLAPVAHFGAARLRMVQVDDISLSDFEDELEKAAVVVLTADVRRCFSYFIKKGAGDPTYIEAIHRL